MKKNKNFLKKLAAVTLGFVMTLGVGAAGYAASANETQAAATSPETSGTGSTSGTGTSLTIDWSFADGNIHIVQKKGKSSTSVNSTYTAAGRIYQYHYLEVTASNGYVVDKIEITKDGSYGGAGVAGGSSISNNMVGNTSDVTTSNLTFTPKSSCNTHFYIQNCQNGSTNTQLRFVSGGIKVYWTAGSSKKLTSIAVSGTPTTTTYTVGDSFDPAGLIVTGTYDDASQEPLTDGIEWTCTPATFSSAGSQSVSVIAEFGNISSQSYTVNNITVQAPPPIITITRNSFTDAQGYGTPSSWEQSNVSGKAEIYGTENTKMQFNKGASSGHSIGGIWNTTPVPGAITKISATTASGTNRAWNAWVYSSACSYGTSFVDGQNKTKINNSAVTIGTSETNIGTSTAGYTYFFIQCDVTGASYISEFKIYYEAAQQYNVTPTLSNCTSDGASTCNTGANYEANITLSNGYDVLSLTNVKSNNVALTLGTDYTWSNNKLVVKKEAIKGDITYTATGSKSPKDVSLSNDSEHVTLSGSASVGYHNSYSATINADTNYERPASVTVTMGGSNFTNFSYTQSNGAFSIDSGLITGNIVIKAVATAHVFEVDYSGLVNISYSEDSDSSRAYLGSFSATLTAEQHYTLNEATITVTMGGNTQSGAYNPTNHKVEIASVTGDIVISGEAIEISGPEISLSKYESEFEYMSSDTITITATNATVTGISASCVDGVDVAEFDLDDDYETIIVSCIDYGIGYYDLTVSYEDNGGNPGSQTIEDFGVQVNRHTALSFSLTNATTDKTSTTSYEYGTKFDIRVTPNQYYTLEEGDITVLADGDDITDTVTVIDSDEALISLEDEYDSVSITVNATKIPAYVVSIAITTQATTKTFNVGATFNHDGIVITGTNNDGTSAGIVTSMCQFSAPDMLTAGTKTVTITYNNDSSISTSYTITVTETALLDGGLSSLTWKLDDEDMTLGRVYEDIELAQTNVGNWALSSGEVYNSKGYNYVLGDYSTSNGEWSSFSQMENFKSVANGLKELNLVNLRVDGTTIYGRYGAIISKDFKISRLYKAEINWTGFVCSSGTTIKNEIYILGSKNGGVSWEKLGEKTDVTIGATSAGSLSWTNINKYSSSDKVLIAIAYVSNSEATSTSSPAIRNLTWKFYGDALNKNQTWNAFDFTLNKEAETLKVGEEDTLSVTPVPNFAQDSFTWTSSNEDVVTVENGVVNAVGEGSATITATSSQGVEKSCSYTIGPADIHVTGVSIKYNNVVVTSDSIQERSTRTYVADVQPADATDKSVTWSISEISPAGCASINSSTGEVTASAAGSAKITVTTTDGSKSASCVITITAYPSYNIVYKAGDGTGADITDKYDYDKDATARAANTFTAPNGKKFDHWLGSDTNTYNAGAAISKLSSGSTLTLTAVYVANTYTITYLDQGGNAYSGSTISSPTSYTYGVGATLPTVTKSGFSFGGWYAESACSGSPVTSISTSDYGNKTFYAKWTFNAEDGLNNVQKSIGLAYTYSNTPTPAKASYQKITSTSDLTLGKYLIVYESGSKAFNGALEADAAGNNISVSISNGEIALTTETNAAAVTIDPTDGSILNSLETKYIGHTGSSNSLNYKNKSSGAYDNEISFENGNVKFENGAYQLKFNSGDNRFRYYKSGQESIALYKYVNQAAKTYSNVDFRFNFKFKGIATFAEANHVDSDYGLVISYSGRTRYFSVKNKQVLENGKDNVSLNYKETGTDEGYFTIRLGIKGDVMNYLEQSQIKYKVQVYTQDSAGNKYTSDTFVEFSVQSMIEQYYNDPRYCTQAVKDLYAIFGPTAKEE